MSSGQAVRCETRHHSPCNFYRSRIKRVTKYNHIVSQAGSNFGLDNQWDEIAGAAYADNGNVEARIDSQYIRRKRAYSLDGDFRIFDRGQYMIVRGN